MSTIIRYVVIFAATALLVYLAFSSIETTGSVSKGEFLRQTWDSADKLMLFLMFVAAMVSHVVRAERWRMLMVPAGHRVPFLPVFLSLMVGYLVNLVIPRGGEVSRALNLYRLEDVKPEVSFGTVITERLADVAFLLLFVGLSFWVEWDKLGAFLAGLPIGEGGGFRIPVWVYVLAGLAVLLIFLYRRFRSHPALKSFISGFRTGFLSVFRLENKALFGVYSILIWALYLLTTWLVMKAFPGTAVLGPGAVFTIFALGSVAMAVPLPGGTGSYHTLVPLGLTALYSLKASDAVALVFIFHALQTLILVAAGLLSLLISLWLRKKKTEAQQVNHNQGAI